MISENTAKLVKEGKYMGITLHDFINPKPKEHFDDPKAEALKRLKNCGVKVVSENECL